MNPFADARAVARYAAETPAKVPGFDDLHRMATILLSENAPADARILVVGAGGGLELRAMARLRPDWRFVGVDPAEPMIAIAHETTAEFSDRIELVVGTVDQLDLSLFDGATCLLTLHFLEREDRLATLREIHRRLRPGSILACAHHCAIAPDPAAWIARSIVFARGSTYPDGTAVEASSAMMGRVTLLAPDEEEGLLREAGFADVKEFYSALSFRGFIGVRHAV